MKNSDVLSTPQSQSFSSLKCNNTPFGQLVPYGDPSWYQNWKSAYYNDSHVRFRDSVRVFVEKEIIPYVYEWDENKKIPRNLQNRLYQAGILPAFVSYQWPTDLCEDNIAGGVKPEEFDAFHALIAFDELSRCGSAGVVWGLVAGLSIGIPPILHYGTDFLKQKVKSCLAGEKIIALAITEPESGSDVAVLKTAAVKTPDGKYYIVNGEKKWITNGTYADYFTVAVRTGGSGMKGISLLLIERGMQGLSTRQMNCAGVWPSGTAFVTFEDVKVPMENLIGNENNGFEYIMHNFNHERWSFIVEAVRFARVCLEESIIYAHKRKTFGKRLIDHPIIRDKIGNMTRQVESSQNWLENLTLQFCRLPEKDQPKILAGPVALLKVQSTRTFEYCAREAAQIFGGLSYTRGGQGEKVERLYREVRAMAIPAGSEEIMIELGVKQLIKNAKL